MKTELLTMGHLLERRQLRQRFRRPGDHGGRRSRPASTEAEVAPEDYSANLVAQLGPNGVTEWIN